MSIPIRFDADAQDPSRFPRNCCGAVPSWAQELIDADIGIAREDQRYHAETMPFGEPKMTFREEGKPGITVGPVIGRVTDRSVRILIETNRSGDITCYLKGMNENLSQTHKLKKHVTVEAGIPVTFGVAGLLPSHTYAVSFSVPAFNLVHSKFKTMPSNDYDLELTPFHFAVVAGNTIQSYEEEAPVPKDKETRQSPVLLSRKTHVTRASLWKDLYHQVCRGKIRYIFHVGNNVPIGGSSSAFKRALNDGLSEQECKEAFRNEYRREWNEPWTKHVLANVPNLMIMNETDIGNFVSNQALTGPEFHIAMSAFDVYREYQQSLCSRLREAEEPEDLFCHWAVQIAPQVGVLLLDFRCAPTFGQKGNSGPTDLLGRAQRHRIKHALTKKFTTKGGGTHSPVNSLLVLSPVQMSNPSTHIQNPQFRNDLNWLLEVLFAWRDKNAPRNVREVAIVSGTEFKGSSGGALDIMRLRGPSEQFIREVVTGPISTPAPTGFSKFVAQFSSKHVNFDAKTKCDGTCCPCPQHNYTLGTVGQRLEATDKAEDAQFSYFGVAHPVFWFQRRSVPTRCCAAKAVDLSVVGTSKDCKIAAGKWVHTCPQPPKSETLSLKKALKDKLTNHAVKPSSHKSNLPKQLQSLEGFKEVHNM